MKLVLAVIKEYLPLLVPLFVVDIVLFVMTLRHILTHETYKYGSRKLWLVIGIVFGLNFMGPIAYFLFGREDE